jgi:hypothetical protein
VCLKVSVRAALSGCNRVNGKFNGKRPSGGRPSIERSPRHYNARDGGGKVHYVEALNEYRTGSPPSVFLAGGISGCPDWQREVVDLLRDEPVTVLNPRRAAFPIGDPTEAPRQIEWEHRHLRLADAILFWFPREALCPIALYELGAWSMTRKPLFPGVHPDYPRRQDVEVQTQLARPDVTVVHALADLAEQVRRWLRAGAPTGQ